MFFNRYEWFIGLRYLRAKRSQHFISVITFFSMGGIALGVAALIVVLAVMTGFREELQRQILGVTSHVVVRSFSGGLSDHPALLQRASQVPGVVAATPFIAGQAMLSAHGYAAGVAVRGIDPVRDKKVSDLAANLTRGRLEQLAGFGIILGKRLALSMGLGLHDRVMVMVAAGNITPIGTLPRFKRFTVAGIFDSGMYEYDSSLAYVHIKDAQTLFRLGNNITGIEIKTPHPDSAFQVKQALVKTLGKGFWIQDWMEMNRNFFRALKLEKATMFVILFLVVVVAAFNIISSLIMVVMEKGREIAILKTMGATPGSIMTIFVINGGVIGLVGTFSGLALGLALAFNLEPVLAFIEKIFSMQILSGEVYYIDHLPSRVVTTDVVWITGISLAISLCAALYPAWRAARVDPVEALRYE